MTHKTQVLHRIHEYLVGEQIACGTFSSVRSAFQKNAFEPVAIKMISKRKLIKLQKNHSSIVFGECALGPLLTHPNIARIREAIETEGQIFQVMNLYQSDLREFLCDPTSVGGLDFIECLQIADDILAAIEYLHSNFICHRDIKVDNILIDVKSANYEISPTNSTNSACCSYTSKFTKRAALTDFGFSNFAFGIQTETLGSIGTTAPEVFNQCYDGMKADMWSFGILLYTLFSKKTPFPDVYDTRGLSAKNLDMSSIPPPIGEMIVSLLSPKPSNRPTATELRAHRIFKMLPERTINNNFPEYSKAITSPEQILVDRISEILDNKCEEIIHDLNSNEANKSKVLYHLLENVITESNYDMNDEETENYKSFCSRHVSSCPPPTPSMLQCITGECRKNKCFSVKKQINEVSGILNNFLIKQKFCVSINPDGIRKAILNTAQEDIQMYFQMTNNGEDCTISVSGDESNADEIDTICENLQRNLSESQ
ncbi:CAMK family protein kinase [Tritrichomonas foetus]|uniref:CAMK family protein kinase n=1 Tax=Tritrichomonas foetus TaxID=1144522 RepID=A0A1J4JZF0_9EUKA|nr:CAMK family protein kinase [Tritrichomonas foetus]|eukprot:OHT02870.1 CAMK family protein kinase [Tritrichomonas foetus]